MEPRKSFLLRMSPQLWEALNAWAQEDMRSVNGQIEFLLRQAVARRAKAKGDLEQAPESEAPDSGDEGT